MTEELHDPQLINLKGYIEGRFNGFETRFDDILRRVSTVEQVGEIQGEELDKIKLRLAHDQGRREERERRSSIDRWMVGLIVGLPAGLLALATLVLQLMGAPR